MKKILFENGTTIDGASTFNQMQNNVEEVFNGEEPMGSIVVDDIECKNLFNINNAKFVTFYNVYSSITSTGVKANSRGDISEAAYMRYNLIDLRGLEGKTITLSWVANTNRSDNFRDFVAELYYTNGRSTSDLITWTAPNKFSFTVKEDLGDLYLLAATFIANRAGNTFKSGEYVEFADIQIELGDEATTYVPYKKFGYNSQESMGKIVVDDINCKNLFDINTMVEGINSYRNFQDGILVAMAQFNSLKIPVNPNTTYSFSTNATAWSNLCFFDKSMNYISGLAFDNQNTITTIDNCYYITIAVKSDYTWCQLEKGSTATEYTPYKKFGYNENESMGKIVVDDVSCKNKFNKNSATRGYLISHETGNLESNNAYASSDFIEVNPNEKYTISNFNTWYTACYDENKNYLGNPKVYYDVITTLPNAKYIRCSVEISKLDVAQVEKGDKATPYTPYKRFGYITGNTNGIEWIKYDDGRCELSGRLIISAGKEATVTFPFELINNEYSITLSYYFQHYHMLYLTYYDVRKELFKTSAFQTNGQTLEYDQDVSFHVVGRWKDNIISSVSTMSLEETE